jgi:hypothetical protein
MNDSQKENFDKFMQEAEVIASFLRQQVNQGRIKEQLYVGQIKNYLIALEEVKKIFN